MYRTKILIVDDDPYIYELVAEQMLSSSEYECFHAIDGVEGIEMVEQKQPDMILLDLVMPGLTGKDMLVGIQQKKYRGPIIVSTKKDNEKQAIDAFRLGATDFITKPIRPPELMAAIERGMNEVNLRKEHQNLLHKLQSTNSVLEDRVNQLTQLSQVSRTLSQMRSLDDLFETVLNSMIQITHADHATLILQDPQSKKLTLRAGKNLTLVMQENLGGVIRDELAELVLTSHEPLVAEGEGLQRFKISREIKAVVYVPIIIHNRPLGVLTVGNHRKKQAFRDSDAQALTSIADYLGIGITNANLFNVLEQRAQDTEQILKNKDAEWQSIIQKLQTPTVKLRDILKVIHTASPVAATPEQLAVVAQQVQQLLKIHHQLAQSSPKKNIGIHRIE